MRHPRVLDAVESIVGPDILVWGTSFFIKEPRNRSFVSWHQDLTYWGLDPADIVTAWIALSESTLAERRHARHPGHAHHARSSRTRIRSPPTTC